MWITFKSCIFAFWNNLFDAVPTPCCVVNYIQILYLCILKQHKFHLLQSCNGCELHSNLVSLHSETTCNVKKMTNGQLWITFKSCIFAFWNNLSPVPGWLSPVVNYIQILYLCILKQRWCKNQTAISRCELHSNLVSLHSETT